MLKIPQKRKFLKNRRPVPYGVSCRQNEVCLGHYGLKITKSVLLSDKHFESARKVITKKIKKVGGRFWTRCSLNLAVTDKPSDVRMGGGKGPIDRWIADAKAGMVIFEFQGISKEEADELGRKILLKLPTKGYIVKKRFAF